MDICLGLLNTAKEPGTFVAEWLNKGDKSTRKSKTRSLGSFLALLLEIARNEGPRGRTVSLKWEALCHQIERLGGGRFGGSRIPGHQRALVLDSDDWGFNLCVEVCPRGSGLDFTAYPVGEDSRAFWCFAQLIQTGFIDRVRLCPNCRRFFFALRTDSKLCSQRCRESAWRKTDEGRKARATYMKRYRKSLKALEGAKTKGYRRKRGRNLHVELRKGE